MLCNRDIAHKAGSGDKKLTHIQGFSIVRRPFIQTLISPFLHVLHWALAGDTMLAS